MLVGLGLLFAVFLEDRFRSRLLRIAIALYCGVAVWSALQIGPELRLAHIVTTPGMFGVTPAGDTVQLQHMNYTAASESTEAGLFPLLALLWLAIAPVVRGTKNKAEGPEETVGATTRARAPFVSAQP